jgi:hypothetical protein
LVTHYERAAGNQPNGDKTWRTRLMFDLTHFKDNWLLGSHEFKLGFTFDRAKGTNYFSFPADTILLEMNGQPLIKMVQDHRDIVPEGMQEYNAYAQDGWTIKDRLTLNLGLRWSYSSARVLDVVTPDGTTKKGRGQMYAWNNISPRLGISYALTRDNKTVLKMSWGRFFDADNWMIFYGFGPYSQTVTTYFWDPSSKSWIFSDISGPATNTNIDPNLKRYYADVLTAGIQREIFANFSIELNYVHKYFGNQLAYINTQGQYVSQTAIDPVTGQSIIVYNQTNVGDNYYLETNPKDFNYKYDGADLIATKRFSDNWFAQASFHWQKCEGLGTNDYEARSGYHDILKDPNNKINAVGPAPYDRTYLLRFLVSYFIRPVGINAALIFNYVQGPRYGRQFEVLLNQGWKSINAIPRNSLVGDPLSTLDLRLEKTFAVLKGNLGILLDVHNAFNSDKATSLNTLMGTDSTPVVLAIQDPRYFQLGVRLTF